MKKYKKIPGRDIIAAMITNEMSAALLGHKIGKDADYVRSVCRYGVTGPQMAAFVLALDMKKYKEGEAVI